ncbi:hypothetical protein F5Y14DRAFT_424180 [Nemania sp. NC0429]|nr:hypothetical protein F5Y14DRAFT_424180 [Nemania sp. NC0429]
MTLFNLPLAKMRSRVLCTSTVTMCAHLRTLRQAFAVLDFLFLASIRLSIVLHLALGHYPDCIVGFGISFVEPGSARVARPQ